MLFSSSGWPPMGMGGDGEGREAIPPFAQFPDAKSLLCDIDGDWILIARGAEAAVWEMVLFGVPCVAKITEPKRWRIRQLDEKLRAERIRNEARTNARCLRAGIHVARVVFVDLAVSTVVFERLVGPSLKVWLLAHEPSECEGVMREVGVLVSRLHVEGIIHGDLTTSNMMMHRRGDEGALHVHLIDFGLSFSSATAEDRAVDLYVLEKAFISSHPNAVALLESVWEGYRMTAPKAAAAVFVRLTKVRARGRKRTMSD